MRVLHFYKTYFPDTYGGVEQVIYQIAQGAVSQGVGTRILTLTRSSGIGPCRVGNHVVERLPLDLEIASNAFSLRSIGRLRDMAADADVIHYHFPWPFMDLAHFLARIDKPSVVTYHSDIVRQKFLNRIYSPLRNRFLSNVTRIVATSPNYLDTSDVLRVHREKTVVIPIGLDDSSYPDIDADCVDRWRKTVGSNFFLFVGALRYYKGLHFLLDAIDGTNLKVVIVGGGPMERALKEQAGRLKGAQVDFLGMLPDSDKVALLHLAKGVVFPSYLRSEAFGVSLLEGAMYAKPLISTDIGTGTSYINVNGETGIIVPPENPSALRQAMEYILEHPDVAREMGWRGRQRYESLFTAERMVGSYIKLYGEIVGNCGSPDGDTPTT